jgi:hypothetical protein
MGFFMRTHISVFVALLSLGGAVTVWASPRTLPVPPPQVRETSVLNESQPKPVTPPVPTRGQMLYENHCMSCHESVVFIRGTRRTQSLKALQEQVSHWAGYLHLRWDRQEVADVVTYLNTHYYKFESR